MWAAIIAAGAAVVTAVIGELSASGREEEARELMRAAASEYNIPLPEFQRAVTEQLGPSAMEGVLADEQSVATQRAALERLAQLAEGGPDAQYDAMLADAMSDAGNFASRQMAGARDAMAARGTLGGGQEAVMLAMGAQQGANRAARGAMDAAAERQRRAYQALRDGSGLAGEVRGQRFAEDSRRAQARDLIARQNADLRIDSRRYQDDLAQRQFGNALDRARGRANTMIGQSTQARQEGADMRQAAAGYGQAAGQAAQAIYGQQQAQQGQQAATNAATDEDWRNWNV